MPDSFEENLAFGQMGESTIAKWLRARGASVLPAYEKEIDTGKGPRLFGPDGQLVTPDLFVFPALEFIEAKHKSVFTWYHIGRRWVTGIDLHHYRDYQRVETETGRRVWLFFLHRISTPDAIDLRGRSDCRRCQSSERGTCCPPHCPTGLFGGSLQFLMRNQSHTSDRYGRHGMVYWAHDVLKFHCTLDELTAMGALS